MTELKKLKDTLKDEMRSAGVNIAKLAELTGIAPQYIQALVENDYGQLPAAPYVRGYLMKIAEVLETDGNDLWKQYSYESQIKRSGISDTLPSNRFAIKGTNKMGIGIAVAVLIALIYLIPILADFFGKPSLEVATPSSDSLVVSSSAYVIQGKVKNTEDRVFINETEIPVKPDGSFELQGELQEGPNAFVITAKRFLGKSTTINRTVFFSTSTSPAEAETSKEDTSSSTNE